MTWAAEHPHRARWRRSEVVAPSGVRATVRPIGAFEVGLLAALVGAWGAGSVFWGPLFGYKPTSATAWDWTMQNWLLHLVPGAVGVFAGLMIIFTSPARRTIGRGPLALGALLLMAAGSWFVLGPVAWPTFQSGPPFATGVSAMTNFWNQLGSSLGPGLLLAMLGGMAMKAGIARPAVAIGDEVPATAAPVATAAAPAETAAAPAGPATTPAGTAATPAGTAATPAGTAATPAGTAATPAGTAAAPAGTAAAPAETTTTGTAAHEPVVERPVNERPVTERPAEGGVL